MERLFGGIRKSDKGQPVAEMFKQGFCFLMDCTSRHLVYFDALKKDAGYAAGIETAPADMLSSHAVKRFFGAFSWYRLWLFRTLLQQLFLWRVKMVKPEVIVLGLDTMVMDNDEAQKRHGVQHTYKKVKGFQPLQLTWGRLAIDAVFRGGQQTQQPRGYRGQDGGACRGYHPQTLRGGCAHHHPDRCRVF